MTVFASRAHALFQARIWREYASTRRDWAQRFLGASRGYCLRRAHAAAVWLRNNRDLPPAAAIRRLSIEQGDQDGGAAIP